jgi:hypothetical protein
MVSKVSASMDLPVLNLAEATKSVSWGDPFRSLF